MKSSALCLKETTRDTICGGVNIGNEIQMAKATTSARAPRGTKVLTQAFFDAVDAIPEPQRAAVVKASLAAIRDELKAVREKAAAAKAKAKSASPAKKAAGKPVKKADPKTAAKIAAPGKAGTAKKIGRPAGTKNKPKIAEVPVAVAEAAAPKATKKAAPKAKATKPDTVEQVAAE
jgi:hypothetical protein